jgi:hypothetical protein
VAQFRHQQQQQQQQQGDVELEVQRDAFGSWTACAGGGSGGLPAAPDAAALEAAMEF